MVIPTPIQKLNDEIGGGFRAGKVTTIFGGRCVGKTTFMFDCMYRAVLSGASCLYMSPVGRRGIVPMEELRQEYADNSETAKGASVTKCSCLSAEALDFRLGRFVDTKSMFLLDDVRISDPEALTKFAKDNDKVIVVSVTTKHFGLTINSEAVIGIERHLLRVLKSKEGRPGGEPIKYNLPRFRAHVVSQPDNPFEGMIYNPFTKKWSWL